MTGSFFSLLDAKASLPLFKQQHEHAQCGEKKYIYRKSSEKEEKCIIIQY